MDACPGVKVMDGNPEWTAGSCMRGIDCYRIHYAVRALVQELAVVKSAYVPVPFKANWGLSRGLSTCVTVLGGSLCLLNEADLPRPEKARFQRVVSIIAHFAFFSVAAFCLKVLRSSRAKNHPEIS